jgi:hypothetical protein
MPTDGKTADAGQAPSEPAPRPKRRGRAAAIVVALVAAGGAAAVAVTDPFDGNGKENTALASVETSTGLAKVTNGTLSARTQQDGTLGYSGEYQVVNKTSGTATKLPSVGDVINQGKVLYWINDTPVVLLKGSLPVYRELSRGMEGRDVQQLNAALVSLGYATKDELDPESDYFSRATRRALKELQDDVGLEETGKLTLGQAVFMPVDKFRVTKVDAVRGAMAPDGRTILTGSSTAREVTVDLNASQQANVAVGDKVTITLPNGSTTPGVVTSVGKVAEKAEEKTTVEVKIKPSDPKATGTLDQSPVQVAIVSDTVENVLSVPVDALLAQAGGTYAVEVVGADKKHRLIPVKTGLFDDSAGRVQVTGSGLRAGQDVVVPGT